MTAMRQSVPLLLAGVLAACGGEGPPTTGGDLGRIFDAPPAEGTGASDVPTGRAEAVDQRFNLIVPEELDIFRLAELDRAPASILWRRGRGVLVYGDGRTGRLQQWSAVAGVEAGRSDLFSAARAGLAEADAAAEVDAAAAGLDGGAEAGGAGASAAGGPPAPLMLTLDRRHALVALDGREGRLSTAPAAEPSAPRVRWEAPPGGVWAGFSGPVYRPGVDGELWFGVREAPDGPGFYRFESALMDGVWRGPERVTPVEGVLSMAFAPDGSGLYFTAAAQSGDLLLRRLPGGRLLSSGGETLAAVPAGASDGADAAPKGVAVDLASNVYIAAPGGIRVFDPRGLVLGNISMPSQVESVAWGRDGSWLYAGAADGLYGMAVFHAGAGLPAGPPEIAVHTNRGRFDLQLRPDAAPVTVVNFLRYAHERFYEGSIFHRVVAGFVVQGGGFDSLLTPFPLQREPIPNEAGNGLEHIRGSVAMARIAAPDSATSQFFVNLVDNRGRGLSRVEGDPERSGYAVFGGVVSGMHVVDAISVLPVSQVRDHHYVPDDAVVINRVEVLP